MSILIKCQAHPGYSGRLRPGIPCDACYMIYGVMTAVEASDGKLISSNPQGVNAPRLGLATSGELLGELRARMTVDGTISYKTVSGSF